MGTKRLFSYSFHKKLNLCDEKNNTLSENGMGTLYFLKMYTGVYLYKLFAGENCLSILVL